MWITDSPVRNKPVYFPSFPLNNPGGNALLCADPTACAAAIMGLSLKDKQRWGSNTAAASQSSCQSICMFALLLFCRDSNKFYNDRNRTVKVAARDCVVPGIVQEEKKSHQRDVSLPLGTLDETNSSERHSLVFKDTNIYHETAAGLHSVSHC